MIGPRTVLLVTGAAALAACADASGEVRGGDPRFDAAPPGPAPEEDAAADAGPFPEDLLDAGTGATWTDLYRDLFGPTGGASCAGDGLCHGSADQAGAVASGFVCDSQAGCRASMLGNSGLVKSADFTAPQQSFLATIVRRRRSDGSLLGSMPKRPAYVFSRASMERIQTWIQNGAPDD